MRRPSRSLPARRLAAAVAVWGFVLAMALPAAVAAHPLGNFTINHYAGLRVEPDRVVLDLVIDQAEVPAFQSRLALDTDDDGEISEAEAKEQTVQRTRRFARRQDSWFRKDPRITWVDHDDPQRVEQAVAAVQAAAGLLS